MGFLIDATPVKIGDEIDAVGWSALCETARMFRVCAGALGPTDWTALDPVEMLALEEVDKWRRAELAVMIGRATQGPLESAAVLAPVDGGRAFRSCRLRELHERSKGLKA